MVRMRISSVDYHGRVYLPKELGLKANKVIILRQGDSFLIIPVPDDIEPIGTELHLKELKRRAEEKAKAEATKGR